MEGGEGAPWREGHYRTSSGNIFRFSGSRATKVDDTDLQVHLKSGDFGEADQEVTKATGVARYSVEITFIKVDTVIKIVLAVLTNQGSKLTFTNASVTCPVHTWEWVTEEEAEVHMERMEAECEPAAAPASHYVEEPERQGRLIWLTGPPGLGARTRRQP